MTENILKSKFNLKTVFLFAYIILLFGFLSAYMFNRFQEESGFNIWIFSTFLMFFVLFLSAALFTFSFFSSIEINKQSLTIKNFYRKRVIPFTSIKNIELSKIIKYHSFFADSTHIHLRNGNIVVLYPFKYANFYKIKLILNSVIHLNEAFKSHLFTPKDSDFKQNNSNTVKTYNTSHILSLTGLLLYSLLLSTMIGLTQNTDSNATHISNLIFLVLQVLFVLAIASSMMNYFEISSTHLTIRNSILFWKKRNFQLNKISSVEILNFYRMPGYYIVIKTDYFETKTFHSDNLFNQKWDKLINHLKSEKIEVLDRRNRNTEQRTLY